MTGRRSHGRLSALNGVVHQGTCRSPSGDRCSHYRWGVHVDIRARRKGRLVAWSAVGPGTPMRDGVTAL